jgi:phospholipase C
MHGVRGFQDPNAHVLPNGKPVWYQRVDGTLSNDTDFLMPFWMNEAGGKYANSTQCAVAGSNGFANNHGALHNGANDLWALGNTPYSLGYFREQGASPPYILAAQPLTRI